MIWNCKHCGPLVPSEVTESEECGVCQHPITYRAKGKVKGKSLQEIVDRGIDRRLAAMGVNLDARC